MASLKNYFANPTTLRKPEHFFGRRDLLVHIFELVEARQNFALVGPQRIGKTSLLTCLESPKIQQECHFDGSHFLFLSLDLQRRSMKGQVDFFDFVYQTLKEYARDLKYPIPEGFDKDDEFDALLNEFRQHSLSPVLMMDAFDEITQYPPIQETKGKFRILPLRSQNWEKFFANWRLRIQNNPHLFTILLLQSDWKLFQQRRHGRFCWRLLL